MKHKRFKIFAAAALSLFGIFSETLFGSLAFAAPGYEKIYEKYDRTDALKDTVSYGMTPIYADEIEDGTYVLDVSSSSSFFKILEAKVTVSGDEMTAVLTMYSSSYLYVYPGTPEEAAEAELDDYIPLVTTDDDRWTFTVPVEALNKGIDLSAFSKRREMWYGRILVFWASSLPEGAVDFEVPDYTRIDAAIELYDDENGTDSLTELYGSSDADDSTALNLSDPVEMEEKDGEYSIEVDMTGGSGRASITSPTWLYVRDGLGYAKLLWSSTYYDYMIVGGKKYTNETTDGSNSTFTIPIIAINEPFTVIADTTAMGDPIEIEYELTFYSDTVGGKGRVPQEAAKTVVIIALVIIIGGGIVNHVVKKRKRA